ncbi:DUF1007 family protein [Ruegeria sp. ANG-S4]|uniref:DUF1007 family protein n=1 Tax=Ruegeria sp. ANG-S4 TaxID=1577904 RepID=UPI000A6758A6|nr:DUF1007 family protein [Ruegeria sp. ANG-S4]
MTGWAGSCACERNVVAVDWQATYLRIMRWLLTFLTCCLPIPGLTHPHVFIDTGLEFIVDETGNLTHVRVTWAYDELYSLFQLEDMNLDQDGDGVLTKAEQTHLAGFDAQWMEGYNGDLVVHSGGKPVPLSGPMQATALTEDGRIVTTHLREVEGGPVSATALSAKAYDETYYTAYEVTRPVTVSGPAICAVERIDPDIDGQLAQMRAFLLTLDANYDLEENDIPLVGESFATEILVSCPGT